MIRIVRPASVALLGVALTTAPLLAGCADTGAGSGSGSASATTSASDASASATPSWTRPADPEDLLLQLSRGGGLVPPSIGLGLFPEFSLYADGTLITRGAQTEQYPYPALPPVLVQQVDPADLGTVMAAVSAQLTGLPEDLGTPQTADVPGLAVIWDDQGTDEVVRAFSYGVGDESAGPGMTQEQVDARAKVRAVVLLADDLAAGTVDGVTVSSAEAYRPDAWLVYSTPYEEPSGDLPAQQELPWPGPALSGTDVGPGYGCRVVEGDAADTVTDALADAVVTTPWIDGGQRWTVVVRPLLPGDPRACPDY